MAEGINIWDASGNLIMDTNTMTSRPMGSLVVSYPYSTSINIPVGAGKRPWYHFYVNGNAAVGISLSGNTLNLTVSKPYYWNGAAGTVYLFYGEY
nr:hypothetical protein [Brevundimonas naejangsanensis]